MILVDEVDRHLLRYAWVPNSEAKPYYKARVDGRVQYLHRIIAGAEPHQLVDHINGDVSDNRRSNLRLCDRFESNCNRSRRRDSRAPYKGITQTSSGRWLAQIMARKKYVRIGLFDTPELAAAAYDRAALELHGRFAKTNGFVTRERDHAA
jgi:hypothetical protein